MRRPQADRDGLGCAHRSTKSTIVSSSHHRCVASLLYTRRPENRGRCHPCCLRRQEFFAWRTSPRIQSTRDCQRVAPSNDSDEHASFQLENQSRWLQLPRFPFCLTLLVYLLCLRLRDYECANNQDAENRD